MNTSNNPTGNSQARIIGCPLNPDKIKWAEIPEIYTIEELVRRAILLTRKEISPYPSHYLVGIHSHYNAFLHAEELWYHHILVLRRYKGEKDFYKFPHTVNLLIKRN